MRNCAQRRRSSSSPKGVFGENGMGKEIYLIVGLGNVGEKYAHTRHNAGFDVMEKLAGKLGVSLRKRLLLKGMTAKAADGDREIILCEPTTYMNHSGECVKQLLRRYGCPPAASGSGKTAEPARTTACGASSAASGPRIFRGSASGPGTGPRGRTWWNGCWAAAKGKNGNGWSRHLTTRQKAPLYGCAAGSIRR